MVGSWERLLDNRDRILAEALRLFASRGYEAVGVQEIVEAAGVTKPTLYHYFGSKQGLLDAVLRERFADYIRRMRAAADFTGDLPLTLTRVVATGFAVAREHPTFFRLQLALWFAPPDSDAFRVVAPFDEELDRIIAEMFERAVASHGNMRGRQRRYAATLLGTINTLAGLSLNGYLTLDDALVYHTVHQFSHGIYS
jgi:AcrR family transcriptional regulator